MSKQTTCAGCATPLIWIEGVWKHKEGPFIMAYYASHVATPVEREA